MKLSTYTLWLSRTDKYSLPLSDLWSDEGMAGYEQWSQEPVSGTTSGMVLATLSCG
jgi:hypothetical protein